MLQIFSMAKIIRFILFVLVANVPAASIAQAKQENTRQKKLLLNLASGFLYVVRQNQIDKDSALTAASRLLNIDRLFLITQSDEASFCGDKKFATTKEELRFLKKQLTKYAGKENTRLLNSIGWMYASEQGDLQKNLDSAGLFLERAKLQAATLHDEKGFNESLCYLALCYYKKGELRSGDSCVQKAITLCEKNGNKIGEALALSYKGIYYPYGEPPYKIRIDCLEKAAAFYQQVNDKEDQALMLTDAAYLLFANNELEECKKQTLHSLALQKEIGFPFTHYTTDLLALVSVVGGDNGNFLKYALESVRTMEETNDNICSAYFYARAGAAYSEMDNKTEESTRWYSRALDEFEKTGGDRAMYMILINLADNLESLGRSNEVIDMGERLKKQYPPVNPIDRQNLLLVLGTAYYKIGQTATAGKYYEQAEKLEDAVRAVSGDVNTGHIYLTLGFYYFNTGQFEKSRPYFTKILKGRYPVGVGQAQISQIHLALFTVDSAAGHYHDAVRHLKEYSRLNDSIYNEKESKQIQEWDIAFNTEKKEKNLQLLTKDKQVQELNLKKVMFTRSLIIASALLLLGLLVTGYTLKQRHNTKLQRQQKEINEQNQLLKESLLAQQKLVEDKEWLVKEIHHRVKNNLQMIISLLNAQSEFLEHPSALTAIKESRERMQAVALIHQKLYQPVHGTLINMRDYIREMVDYLGNSFANVKRVNFKLDVEDVSLDVSQAVPLGLILNEAITNAIKYAFPGDQRGTVYILFWHAGKEDLVLEIKDDGKGFPENFDFSNNNSLGLQLIQLFSEQLEGSLKFKSIEGVEISLTFKKFYAENKTPSLLNTL